MGVQSGAVGSQTNNGRNTPQNGQSRSLSDDWLAWIAENKLLGIDDNEIVTVIRRQTGVDEAVASREVELAECNPYFLTARRVGEKLRKLESLLDVHRDVASLSYGYGTVERRSKVSRAEFLERYYAANRPVILTGMLTGSPALVRWKPEYLRATCGDAMVEIMSGRNKDPRYEINAFSHKTQVRFRDYIDEVTSVTKSNDSYLVANNAFFKRPEIKTLYSEVPKFPEYLDEGNEGQIFFWFGPAGTVTPLHHDVMNVLVAQIYGRKRFILISPDQTHYLYNEIGVYSEVDCEQPNYSLYPLFRKVKAINIVLSRGEVLFLPVGWWHHVRALDLSMTVSYISFAYPNSYKWAEPGAY